jgi:hypothetical protein
MGQFAVIQSVAPLVDVDVRPIHIRDALDIERVVAGFARVPNRVTVWRSRAEGRVDRLPDLAADLVRRRPSQSLRFPLRLYSPRRVCVCAKPGFRDDAGRGYWERAFLHSQSDR